MLDRTFMERAERITSFNIETREFESLCYKKEIQSLITKHFFPNFEKPSVEKIDKDELNRLINELKLYDQFYFEKLHHYNLKGVGPGEVTLYYLVDLVHLGGGSSAGVDIVCGDSHYEVKAVDVTKNRIAKNFKLGGTVSLADTMKELHYFLTYYGYEGSDTEIKGSVINKMREEHPYDFHDIEQKFAKEASKYFNGHDIIFINNTKTKSRIGQIEDIKKIEAEDIQIERLTNGTVKPAIKL